MVLGVRRFRENKDMPKANLMGNQITRFVFFLLSGMRYADTQCGLRGYPASVMGKIMNSAGERFEFENTMLLDVRRLAIPVAQVGMPAVYQEEGKYTSHFNKVKDSIRIYKLLLGRALLPLFAALAAFALFLALATQARLCRWEACIWARRSAIWRGGFCCCPACSSAARAYWRRWA